MFSVSSAAMFDKGKGPPVVMIQGLHGRWEWSRTALEELATSCRAISYSLAGDLGSGRRYDPALGFENQMRQLDDVLDRAGLERAALCGVSFGGLVAVRYAATRPHRVSALVLASAPGPGWAPTAQQARWLSRPWLSTPAFVASAPLRVWPEVRRALRRTPACVAFMVRQGVRAAVFPCIPSLMSARIRDARATDFDRDYQCIQAPTLVLTGEPELDRVVSVEVTRRYAAVIEGARHQTIDDTGHLGVLTQPKRFARVISEFVHANHH